MKILIIEDDMDNAELLRIDLEEYSTELEVKDFSVEIDEIKSFDPDCIILDLMSGPVDSGIPLGNDEYNEIWDHSFCPIIVYSAAPEKLPQEASFVYKIKKGSDSSAKKEVIEKIKQIEPFVKIKHELFQEIDEQIRISFKESASAIEPKNASNKLELFRHLMRRRVSATIERDHNHKLPPVAQYIFPPIDDQILFGDILCRNQEKLKVYRMMLTPSCDLSTLGGRQVKVDNVIVADVLPFDPDFFEISTKVEKLIEKLKNHPSTIFLPEIPEIFCNSYIDLKKLYTVPHKEFFDQTSPWKRFLSIDSPFRENVAWKLINYIGRPGLPDIDYSSIAGILIEERKKSCDP